MSIVVDLRHGIGEVESERQVLGIDASEDGHVVAGDVGEHLEALAVTEDGEVVSVLSSLCLMILRTKRAEMKMKMR